MSYILEKNEIIELQQPTSETLFTLQQQALAGDIRSAVSGPESDERIVVVSQDVHPVTGAIMFRLAESHLKDPDASRAVTADDYSLAMNCKLAVGDGFFLVCPPGVLAPPFISVPLP